MKILLTSGGTRLAIDSVRVITNLSTGTFGNHLALALLGKGHDVVFLYAKNSKCPHEVRCNLEKPADGKNIGEVVHEHTMQITERAGLLSQCDGHYEPVAYEDFADYASKLKNLLKQNPDVVILAAAVSDFEPVQTATGKISSDTKEMTIQLQQTPKLIRQVKDICPNTFLVGFKLLVGSTEAELRASMVKQAKNSQADMVVGNDLCDIKNNAHKLTVYLTRESKEECHDVFYIHDNKPGKELASLLADDIVNQRAIEKMYDAKCSRKKKTNLPKPPDFVKPSSMWLVVYECRYSVISVSAKGEGFFAPGQDVLWGFDNVTEWVKEIVPPLLEQVLPVPPVHQWIGFDHVETGNPVPVKAEKPSIRSHCFFSGTTTRPIHGETWEDFQKRFYETERERYTEGKRHVPMSMEQMVKAAQEMWKHFQPVPVKAKERSCLLLGTSTNPIYGETWRDFERRFHAKEGDRYRNMSMEHMAEAAQEMWETCQPVKEQEKSL
jgi:hypothetical protein